MCIFNYLQDLNQALLATNNKIKINLLQFNRYLIGTYFSVKLQSNFPKLSQSLLR